jgi:RimJ/RimL family protein N-acetyltransferase
MGTPSLWCLPFLIQSDIHIAHLGACGFKGAPDEGEVEVGYGVLPMFQRRGVATAAMHELILLAFNEDSVSSVLATIDPTNIASMRVAEKLGFQRHEAYIDEDGNELIQWRCSRFARP